jgi:phytoene synthase
MLAPKSQACMRAAYRLYGGILDEIEAQDCDVFVRRATVPKWKRLAVALSCVLSRPETPPSLLDIPQPRDGSALVDLRGTAA